MTLSIMSDLHLDFGDLELPGGDVLALAGDVFSGAVIKYGEDETASFHHLWKRYVRFCKEELSKYKEVIFVMGNHEYYGLTIETAPHTLRSFLEKNAPNVVLLDNAKHATHNVTFFGTTLWASYGCPRADQERLIQFRLNDCKQIWTTEDGNLRTPRLMTPFDFDRLNRKAKHWLYTQVRMAGEGVKVLVTHHAPSWESHPSGDASDLDWAFYSNVQRIFGWGNSITFAVHGHTHHNVAYVQQMAVIATNQRGYAGVEKMADAFNPKWGVVPFERLLLKLKDRRSVYNHLRRQQRESEGPFVRAKCL